MPGTMESGLLGQQLGNLVNAFSEDFASMLVVKTLPHWPLLQCVKPLV